MRRTSLKCSHCPVDVIFLVLQWKTTFGNYRGVFTSVLCTKLYLRNSSVSLSMA
jgi:hypothetical protein